MSKCINKNCDSLAHRKSMCNKCYRRNLKHTSKRYRFSGIKAKALYKKKTFELTYEQWLEYNKSPCFYCNKPILTNGSGLDRLDNSKGYIMSNVVPCCASCNRIRSVELTPEEMVIAMQAILIYRKI